jgi:hypothetical protein
MPAIGHNPSMRIVDSGRLCLRAAVLAIFCSLALAVTAYADEPAGTLPLAEVSGGAEVSGAQSPQEPQSQDPEGLGTEQQPTAGEGAGGTLEQAESPAEVPAVGGSVGGEPAQVPQVPTEETVQVPPAGGEAPVEAVVVPPSEAPVEAVVVPPSEAPVETVVVPPSEAPVEAVVVPPVEAVVVPPSEAPVETVVVPPSEVPVETVVVKQATQEAAQDDAGGAGGEGSEADSLTHAVAADSAATQGAATRAPAAGEGTQESPVVAGTLPPGPTPPTAEATGPQSPTVRALSGSEKHAKLAAAQRAEAFSCELSVLGGRTTDNCAAGWLGGKRVLDAPAAGFASVAVALAARVAGAPPPGGGHGGSAGANTPVSPTPGPTPSGASGAAVGGASGVGPSGFLSLAGLLMLAAPRALRRLRLSSRPWLTACFVLIPERPG